jgi:hypothetical protein
MGHLLKLKYSHSSVPSAYLASKSVPFRPMTTTVQMPNSELVETKRITVYKNMLRKPHFLAVVSIGSTFHPQAVYCNICPSLPHREKEDEER